MVYILNLVASYLRQIFLSAVFCHKNLGTVWIMIMRMRFLYVLVLKSNSLSVNKIQNVVLQRSIKIVIVTIQFALKNYGHSLACSIVNMYVTKATKFTNLQTYRLAFVTRSNPSGNKNEIQWPTINPSTPQPNKLTLHIPLDFIHDFLLTFLYSLPTLLNLKFLGTVNQAMDPLKIQNKHQIQMYI